MPMGLGPPPGCGSPSPSSAQYHSVSDARWMSVRQEVTVNGCANSVLCEPPGWLANGDAACVGETHWACGSCGSVACQNGLQTTYGAGPPCALLKSVPVNAVLLSIC